MTTAQGPNIFLVSFVTSERKVDRLITRVQLLKAPNSLLSKVLLHGLRENGDDKFGFCAKTASLLILTSGDTAAAWQERSLELFEVSALLSEYWAASLLRAV